jgi:putative FmdB family regulatory protein
MPVYTYRCDNCGHQFDKHQNFSDQPLKACPNCRKHALHKVYQVTGVAFKGSGFYVTDKRNASSSAAKPTKAGTNGSGESKAESKSAPSESKGTPGESKGTPGESKGDSSKPTKKDD